MARELPRTDGTAPPIAPRLLRPIGLCSEPPAPEPSLDTRPDTRIERLCVERGLKMTGQRRVIARVLSESEDHPDVEELYRRASALDGRISIATVYRTVRLLEEKGILARRDFGGGRARYEPTAHGRHYHLIDVETGKVIEFEDGEHERLMQAIAARLGFDLVSHRLELFGRRRVGQARRRRRWKSVHPSTAPMAVGGRAEPAGRPAAHPARRGQVTIARPDLAAMPRDLAPTPMLSERPAVSASCGPATSACALPRRPARSMRCNPSATACSMTRWAPNRTPSPCCPVATSTVSTWWPTT